MAKTRAKPSLHRDSFLAYRDRFVTVLSSGYAYSLNRRAVRRQRKRKPKPVFVKEFYHDVTVFSPLSGLDHLDNFIMTQEYSSIYRDLRPPNA